MTPVALADSVRGPVLTPADAAYAEELAGFDTNLVPTPEIAVGATSVADVQAAVRYARAHRMTVAVQATGHGGPAVAARGLLITTRRLAGVEVDPGSRIAIVRAGTRSRELAAAAGEHGLCYVGGAAGGVGVIGYLLGGGLGPLARSHGVSSDHVVGFTVVDHDGEIVETDADHEPELFWALRGGKGGLGVVVAARVALAPVGTVYGGALTFAAEQIDAVWRGWAEWTATAPDDVTTSLVIVRVPDIEQAPPPLRGRTIAQLRFAHPGTASDGEPLAAPLRALAPVLADGIRELGTADLALIHDDPDEPGPASARGALLTRIDAGLADAVLAVAGPDAALPVVAVEVRHLGPRTQRDVPGGSAVGGRDAAGTLMLVGPPDPRAQREVMPAAYQRVEAALADRIAPYTTVNWAGHDLTAAELQRAWPDGIRHRLQRARQHHDPSGTFALGPA